MRWKIEVDSIHRLDATGDQPDGQRPKSIDSHMLRALNIDVNSTKIWNLFS